jgi:hypothetical protein
LGKGSTGRTTPHNLKEKLAMEQVKSKPWCNEEFSTRLPNGMSDSRWLEKEGWNKYGQKINNVEIHYLRNKYTGDFDDFKFKNGMLK